MNSYLFTGWTTRTETHHDHSGPRNYDTLASMESCNSLIVSAENFETAQSRFERWLGSLSMNPAQPASIKIRKIFAAPVMESLFTELGPQPLDWPKIVEEIAATTEATSVDDFEQGYWLDVNEAVRSGLSIDALRETLPEDVRSGLNWSAEKQFLFLLTVLTPPGPPIEASDDEELESSKTESTEGENSSEPTPSELLDQQEAFPQLVEKEVAAVIRARNSAVAAALWRNYAATTPLAANTIRIEPLCGIGWPTGEEVKSGKAEAT